MRLSYYIEISYKDVNGCHTINLIVGAESIEEAIRITRHMFLESNNIKFIGIQRM